MDSPVRRIAAERLRAYYGLPTASVARCRGELVLVLKRNRTTTCLGNAWGQRLRVPYAEIVEVSDG